MHDMSAMRIKISSKHFINNAMDFNVYKKFMYHNVISKNNENK